MTHPRNYLYRMALFVLAVAGGVTLLWRPLFVYFMGNPAVNGIILGILLAGILYILRQVLRLQPEVRWIERFRRNKDSAASEDAPRLLASMATMLSDRRGSRVILSPASLRTLLDGIASRLDESRETSRYLIGLLVFLGLLGTFYGLLETVQSVKGVIGGLSAGGDAANAFNDLKTRLATPLGGMSTAFSASLFGLAGSLILGFLDLQAGLAQNRFYNDLEEWLSGYTRLSGGISEGEGTVPGFVQALLEQTADSLDSLQRLLGRGEESRIEANANMLALTDRLASLAEQMQAPQQDRGALRTIELHLARLVEEVSRGRVESVQDIRTEIWPLARTIAALAEDAERAEPSR